MRQTVEHECARDAGPDTGVEHRGRIASGTDSCLSDGPAAHVTLDGHGPHDLEDLEGLPVPGDDIPTAEAPSSIYVLGHAHADGADAPPPFDRAACNVLSKSERALEPWIGAPLGGCRHLINDKHATLLVDDGDPRLRASDIDAESE